MGEDRAGPTGPFLEHLGREVRRRRQQAGLTMQQLAETAGISRRMLSHIELGEGNPSLVIIGKIARALGTGFASLAQETRGETLVVNSPGAAPGIWSSPAGSHAALTVASTLRPAAEVWDWTLVPGDTYQAEPDPPGSEELFVVITGTLTLVIGGDTAVGLEAGASARLATDRDYGYRNDGTAPVRFIRVAHVRSP
jgi:transcriptional regulator with XRE-family HTH domain